MIQRPFLVTINVRQLFFTCTKSLPGEEILVCRCKYLMSRLSQSDLRLSTWSEARALWPPPKAGAPWSGGHSNCLSLTWGQHGYQAFSIIFIQWNLHCNNNNISKKKESSEVIVYHHPWGESRRRRRAGWLSSLSGGQRTGHTTRSQQSGGRWEAGGRLGGQRHLPSGGRPPPGPQSSRQGQTRSPASDCGAGSFSQWPPCRPRTEPGPRRTDTRLGLGGSSWPGRTVCTQTRPRPTCPAHSAWAQHPSGWCWSAEVHPWWWLWNGNAARLDFWKMILQIPMLRKGHDSQVVIPLDETELKLFVVKAQPLL